MKLITAFNFKFVASMAIILGAISAHSAPVFSSNASTLSALLDTSNLSFSDTKFSANLSTDSGDSDLYVNSVNLVLGGGWDSALDLNLDFGEASYVFGTAITGGNTVSFNNIARRSGAVDAAVPVGLYNFSLEFFGGASASANGILDTLNYQLEVFQGLQFAITSTATPSTIGQGGTSAITAALTNNMSTRNLVTTTWYWSGDNYTNGSDSLTGNFTGDWFNKTINPGNTRTDDHSTFTASATQALGTYNNNLGVFGGLYDGDWHGMRASNAPIEVVPEPATMTALAIGGLALLRRRRKA